MSIKNRLSPKKIIPILMMVLLSPPLWINALAPKNVRAQESNSCSDIVAPLTAEEEIYARTAWQYFLNNYQESTGFTNSTGGYPSGTLWDMGNYLMALNAVRWMGIIDQGEFDNKLNKFLGSLAGLRLFEDSLPNKVYNASNGELVDYGNNPIERGIGWSALDLGRILAAFHVLRTCHPQYNDWLQSIVDQWALERSLDNGYLYGAAVLEDGQTLLVQEGRLGYEEYAVRGYELWGFSAPKAGSFEPYKLVDIYGVKIPVDTRNYQETNANNYVVSESYILDGIEFGFLGNQMPDFAARVFEVQRRRYLATGQLTAVTEDNIDGPPYFLYNTVFSNGEAWATITEKNELYRDKRSISTKAAFGWRYIFPESEYARQLFEVAKGLMSPDGGGFYAGLYEETNTPNKALTGNTNGLIVEILYYKARGSRPLIGGGGVQPSTGKPEKTIVMKDFPAPEGVSSASPLPSNQSSSNNSPPPNPPAAPVLPAKKPSEPKSQSQTGTKSQPSPVPSPPNLDLNPSSATLEKYRLAKEWAIAERERLLAEKSALKALEKSEARRLKAKKKQQKKEARQKKLEEKRLQLATAQKETILKKSADPELIPSSEPVQTIAIKPVPSVGSLDKSSKLHQFVRPLKMPEQRYAKAAWNYFKKNYDTETGLVADRSDMKGATLWGIGDYLSALQAAEALNIISLEEFDQRVRQLLGVLQQIPLFAGELPHRAYDIRSLKPVDYGLNPKPAGTGWSGLDVGRLLVALHNLKGSHREYTNIVDEIVLDWSFLRVIRDNRVHSATVEADQNGRLVTRVKPDPRLGYEEYAARGFQLWGFDVNEAAVGGDYETRRVEGVEVPVERKRARKRKDVQQVTVSNPFILYGLELGFDPEIKSLVLPLFEAQAKRYQNKGILTAAGTTLSRSNSKVLNSSVTTKRKAWQALYDNGTEASGERVISSAVAFSYYALFPKDEYAQELYRSTLDLYDPNRGFHEGVNEKTGTPSGVFTSETNSLILQALLFQVRGLQPLLVDDTSRKSPWWKALANGEIGTGLPLDATPKLQLVTNSSGNYWDSIQKKKSSQVLTSDKKNSTASLPSSLKVKILPASPFGDSGKSIDLTSVSTTRLSLKNVSNHPTQSDQNEAIFDYFEKASQAPDRLTEEDRKAAQWAWAYFKRNWNPSTGLVNAVEDYRWTTLWDQGSAILGIHSARRLNLISSKEFDIKFSRFLNTLQNLPLTSAGLPHKAYGTKNADLRTLSNLPDPNGSEGWSALDLSRFLLALHVIRTHYPGYRSSINQIVQKWNLKKLINDGWLQGGVGKNGKILLVQEGRLGYEQYAAYGLQLWGIKAQNALYNPPVETRKVEGVSLQVDKRNLQNSGASNYLTNDPYLLWGIELGWTPEVKPQVVNLLNAQRNRYQRTGLLTAVNEDSLDRKPYFIYGSIISDGKPWNTTTSKGTRVVHLNHVSTKAAFAWEALLPTDTYTQVLRKSVQYLADTNRGYFTGRYENQALGSNSVINVNTNAIILESILYKARKNRPLVLD